MATFFYYRYANLHLCGKLFSCTEESYQKLLGKGRITDERKKLVMLLQRYRLLTLEMLATLTGRDKEEIHGELDALTDYGIVIKQFYECDEHDEQIRTETFYCASPKLPAELVNGDKKNNFIWSRDLRIEDAMNILAFNRFHIAFVKNVPKNHLQAQTGYMVGNTWADGRYRLKSKKYHLGYSHMMAVSVRDFSKQNSEVGERLKKISQAYRAGKEKMPWFVLICENPMQCACIQRKLKADADTRELPVYYIIDTDIAMNVNPLQFLQVYQFTDGDKEIRSDILKVEDWF